MKKFLFLLVVIAIISTAGWFAYQKIQSSKETVRSRPTPSVPIEVEPIQSGTIKDIGIFTGSLIPKSQFVVAPKVSGWLKQLLVNVGDTVSPNQIIAILDDAEYTQQVEQAKAELQVAKANAKNRENDLKLAEREYERANALREKQIASVSELDEAEASLNSFNTQLEVAQAQVEQKQAALEAAELRLSYTKVKAFWENDEKTRVVGERFVDEGALLQVNQSIVSVLENDILTAIVYVVEKDYPKIKINQQADIDTDAYPDITFSGKVVRIAPLLRESSRQARVEIEIPNPGKFLKPGMFIRAKIEFANHVDATLVPLAALVRRNDMQGVFIIDNDNNKAVFSPVKTGIVTDQLVEILEPPLSGYVATLGNHLLEDGSSITLSEAK